MEKMHEAISEVNKEQEVVDANCRKHGSSWIKGRSFSIMQAGKH